MGHVKHVSSITADWDEMGWDGMSNRRETRLPGNLQGETTPTQISIRPHGTYNHLKKSDQNVSKMRHALKKCYA